MPYNEDKYIAIKFYGNQNAGVADTKYLSIETTDPSYHVTILPSVQQGAGFFEQKHEDIQAEDDREIAIFYFYSLSRNSINEKFNNFNNEDLFDGWALREGEIHEIVYQNSSLTCAELAYELLETTGIKDLLNRATISSKSLETFKDLHQELSNAKKNELKKHPETKEFMIEGETLGNDRGCAIL